MNSTTFILLMILLLSFIPNIAIPYWTRKTESFGVTVPESMFHNETFKRQRKNYALITGIFSFLVALFFVYFTWNRGENVTEITFTILILFYLLMSFIIYLVFHFKIKKIKQESNWEKAESETVMISTNFRKEKLNYSNTWFLISFLLAIGIIVFTLLNYDLLPSQIPLQYNFSGAVTSTVDTSLRSSLLLPIMQLFLTILFAFINTMIAKAKQQIDSNRPESSLKQSTIFRRRWSLYLVITGNAMGLMLFFLQLSLFYPIDPQIIQLVTLGLTLLLLVGAIYLGISTGQGGSRLQQSANANKSDSIDRDDDKHWKLGMFYFNKDDPALFLEKRFGVGWTVNLARPLPWLILILIIGISIFLPYILS